MDRCGAERNVPWVEDETRCRADEARQDLHSMVPVAFDPPLSSLDLISSHTRQPALRAIGAAFGTSVVESLERVPRGASGAGVFKVVVEGTPYLLRIEASPDCL